MTLYLVLILPFVGALGALLAFWLAAFAGLLLLPGVRRPQWDVKLVPLCIVFAVMNVTYLYAMTLTTAANAILRLSQ